MKLHLAENPQCCLQFLNAISKKFVDSMLEIESLTMDTAISRGGLSGKDFSKGRYAG